MNLTLNELKHSDIYLVDQIFRGRLQPGLRVLDLGCGSGRNLLPFVQMQCPCYGVDLSSQAIDHCKDSFPMLAPEQFYAGDLINHPFPDESFDLVICNALFHFARDKQEFQKWAHKAWQSLKPNGIFFARLSTKIGLPDAQPPGFSFLAEESDILELEQAWEARRLDPLKTTLVEKARTMTTWVLQK